MNGRRQFLKGAGLFSALLAGTTVARGAGTTALLGNPNVHDNAGTTASKAADPSVVAQLEEQHTSSLALTQTYGEIAPPTPPSNFGMSGYVFKSDGNCATWAPGMSINHDGNVCISGSQKNYVPGTENRVDVKMAPGPDGELYLNINGQWKKVVTA